MQSSGLTVPVNTGSIDRAIRFGVAAAILAGLPAVVGNPYGLVAGGMIAGGLLIAGLTGF